MKMVVFGIFAADGTVLADEGVTITCPSDYPNIDSNATSENDCWRECTTDDVANSMSVVGKNYYGSGTDTCEPTQCAAGWQIVPDIVKTIGIDFGTNYAYVTNDNVFTESNWDNLGAKGQDYYGITDKNSFAGDFGNRGMVIGRALCSSQYGDSNGKLWIDPTTFDELNDETGKSGAGYCYCKIDSYISKDGVNQSVIGPWVIYSYIGSECSESCASYCAGTIVRPPNNINSGRLRIALIQDVGTFDACIKRYYRVRSGEYLPAGGETTLICPVDHYCPYATNFPYDTEHDTNLYKCPSDYPNSDAGATSENQCYRKCTTDDVANSVSVSGRNYIGDGYDTCAATECVAGWVLKDFVNIINSNSASAVNSANITNDGVFENGGGLGSEYYGISEPNTFAIDYGDDGMITGHGRCSTKVGNGISYSWDVPTQYDELDDETGQSGANYCYCRVDSYTPVGGLTQILSDETWTFWGQLNSCAQECSLRCKDAIRTKTDWYYKHILGNATCVVPEYVVKSGEYLPAGGEEPVDCPSGYYCPGVGDVKLNDEKDKGLVACPDGYDNSDSGAKSENDCY